MSYPPRPPMGMPPMQPPGMYGYMGMMPPMGMGMMPMMPPPPIASNSAPRKKLVPQEIPKSGSDEKAPVTTVFVGNISERAPDSMIRTMLQRCGNVLSWKRIQAFGFCEYEQPEATLRCMRLLNDWTIADKKLVVKVDAKTKNLLDDYKKKKKKDKGMGGKSEEKEEGEEDDDEDEDVLDEFTQREDRVAQAGLDAIMREYQEDLTRIPASEQEIEDKKNAKKLRKKDEDERALDAMELEDDKKDLINREIRIFRDAHKGEEEETSGPSDKERQDRRRRNDDMREKEMRERDLRERELRERDRDRDRERDRDRDRDRERERDKERERRDWERRARGRSRSRSLERSRSRERTSERDNEIEDEEDAYERRKLERKLREKELAYQELLKKWESRERKKAREYEKEEEREEERASEEHKEARRLKEFLEDYDDERDDPKFYKSSALSRRLKEREKEMELDDRDRQRERDELEEIRRRLTEEGHVDVDEQMARIERERDEHLLPCMAKSPEIREEPEEYLPHPIKEQPPIVVQPDNHLTPSSPDSDHDDGPSGIIIPEPPSSHNTDSQSSVSEPPFMSHSGSVTDMAEPMHLNLAAQLEPSTESPMSSDATPILNQPQQQSSKRRKLTVGDVFNQDDEAEEGPRKRRLQRLDDEEDGSAPLMQLPSKPTTAEDKRKCIKNLIERIPTGKEQLFAYKLDWTMVDGSLMSKRIKPWVNKKIVEYIGEEEPTLSDFICQKVMEHSTPTNVLQDIAMVLDEEAEVFVVKMWRLLIYETEAKKLGLVK